MEETHDQWRFMGENKHGLDIVRWWENSDENHKITIYLSECAKFKRLTISSFVRIWSNWNYYKLLLEMQNETAILVNSFLKVWSYMCQIISHSTPGFSYKKNESVGPHNDIFECDDNFLVITKNWLNICPSVGEWIKKLGCRHTM